VIHNDVPALSAKTMAVGANNGALAAGR